MTAHDFRTPEKLTAHGPRVEVLGSILGKARVHKGRVLQSKHAKEYATEYYRANMLKSTVLQSNNAKEYGTESEC